MEERRKERGMRLWVTIPTMCLLRSVAGLSYPLPLKKLGRKWPCQEIILLRCTTCEGPAAISFTRDASQQEHNIFDVAALDLAAAAGIHLRKAREVDIAQISEIWVDAFRGPFAWWQALTKLQQELIFAQQLRVRLLALEAGQIRHSMFVAADAASGLIVGFSEVGLLPPPPPPPPQSPLSQFLPTLAAFTDGAREGELRSDNIADGGNDGRGDGGGETAEVELVVEESIWAEGIAAAAAVSLFADGVVTIRTADATRAADAVQAAPIEEVPYLANVAVSAARRGRGIGRALVAAAEAVVRSGFFDGPGNSCDCNNGSGGIKESDIGEENDIGDGNGGGDKKCDGGGGGGGGLRRDDALFVAVEPGNAPALRLYRGAGFELVAVDRGRPGGRRRRARSSRAFFKKRLH
ncbi:unnamed protein product [Phaeothamnion confervicola]